ncbi:unnamed protein product [Mucor hiemalis]
MAAINDNVYARVREKVKEHNLTEQEIKAIDTARDQLQTHTYTGGLAGATTAFLLGKRKKFNPIQILAVTGGGFLLGSQMGLISGALAGVKTINSLPNPQRLINVVREVQMEAMKGRQQQLGGGGAGNNRPILRPQPMSPQEIHESQSSQDDFAPNEPVNGRSAWNNKSPASFSNSGEMDVTDETDPLSRPEANRPVNNKQPHPSAWEKIRSENLPNNTWSKIRMEAQKNPQDPAEIAKAKAARVQRLSEGSEFNASSTELPRTREEDMERKTQRKNQWGDPL